MEIMVVDDEILCIEAVARGLRSKGHKVLTVRSANDALQAILSGEYKIDLVVTDYKMPEMNGIDLLKRIRQEKERVPVIMMTALIEQRVMAEAVSAGCDGFLAKPFDLDELIWEIEKVRVLSERLLNPRIGLGRE